MDGAEVQAAFLDPMLVMLSFHYLAYGRHTRDALLLFYAERVGSRKVLLESSGEDEATPFLFVSVVI